MRNSCPICYLPFPLCWAKHQIWQVFLQQIRRSTHASRLDLTVPSSPIKSEALREERVNRVWHAALSSQSVDVASQQPRSYFSFLFCRHVKTSLQTGVHYSSGPRSYSSRCNHAAISLTCHCLCFYVWLVITFYF